MKWKKDVILDKQKSWRLHLDDKVLPIAEGDVYLVKAVEEGICNDEDLVRLIAREEGIDETAAAFGLAQFLLDYSDFIAEDTAHYMITN
ncbi:MAG: hypothetical protein PHE02_08455 [Lachnospiraceae bacterium]|nr:hypothetical protein [Lachnospiraceae bacterium]